MEASPLRLYNTLAKREEEFSTIEPGKVRMYTCGPTVYGRPHIGNYSSFLMADLLRRWLEVKGYEVKHVKNITDVGHLVADRDEGEDKIEKQAKAEKGAVSGQRSAVSAEDVIAIARRYEELFLEDERVLRILEPFARPRASGTIPEMIAIIRTLLDRGHAYETDDGIYFDVHTDLEYGKLSGNTLENLESGARIAVNEEKRHPADFALWKKCVGENAHHLLRWRYPSGERLSGEGEDASAGFPGWHIECSAMSRSLLGEQLDVHTGGEDNIFPHHECEIAQSENSGPKPFSRYWLHKRRIDMGEAKMSKSLGNILTVPDIVAKGFDPLDLRYYFLSVHYRTNLKFTWRGMEDARKARLKIVEWMTEVEGQERQEGFGGTYAEKFAEAMDGDLNTPAALAVLFDAMKETRSNPSLDADQQADVLHLIYIAGRTFGCFESSAENIPADILALAGQRDEARARKDFAASDRIRDELQSRGYEVRDSKEGTKVKRK
ncbi:MAG: cysteine--tRNA ligase [Candidatus Peribacteraceae bacterium]|nr:cysteine--tRNA ligase [Candidatus Peribacteraceae bacterium]